MAGTLLRALRAGASQHERTLRGETYRYKKKATLRA